MSNQAIHVSCGNHCGPRSSRGAEQYETPACTVEALLAREPLPHHLLEPCGSSNSPLVRTLEAHGHTVTAFDLVCDGIDFLRVTELPSSVGGGLTNPPFSIAADIVRHGLTLVPKFIVLERVQWLETRKRAELFESCGLTRVFAFSDRVPRMHQVGWTGKRSSASMCLAWFVFERGHTGAPTIHFLRLPKQRS
jgi:hypothetical protein